MSCESPTFKHDVNDDNNSDNNNNIIFLYFRRTTYLARLPEFLYGPPMNTEIYYHETFNNNAGTIRQ